MRKTESDDQLSQQFSLGRAFDMLEVSKPTRSQNIFRVTTQMLENDGVELPKW